MEEKEFSSETMKAMGWVWSKACSMIDNGEDPREYEIPQLISEALEALK